MSRWEEKKLTPKEAFYRVVSSMCFGAIRNGPKGKPGEVIKRLPKEIRDSLQNLKAEDLQDVRQDQIGDLYGDMYNSMSLKLMRMLINV